MVTSGWEKNLFGQNWKGDSVEVVFFHDQKVGHMEMLILYKFFRSG